MFIGEDAWKVNESMEGSNERIGYLSGYASFRFKATELMQ